MAFGEKANLGWEVIQERRVLLTMSLSLIVSRGTYQRWGFAVTHRAILALAMLGEISHTARGRGSPVCRRALRGVLERAFDSPAHQLASTHALIDDVTHSRLSRRTGDSQTSAVGVCINGQTRLLVNEVVPRIEKVPAKTLQVFATRWA